MSDIHIYLPELCISSNPVAWCMGSSYLKNPTVVVLPLKIK